MMIERLLILPRAEHDVEEHTNYLAQENHELALRFLGGIELAFQRLKEFPTIGSSVRFEDSSFELRRWPIPGFRAYLLFYTVDERILTVVRLLHGAQDQSTAFAELESE
jgi:plasmid stabilization system protein ParE